IGWYQAIRARFPRLGTAPGMGLVEARRPAAAEAVFRDLVPPEPESPRPRLSLVKAPYVHREVPEAGASGEGGVWPPRAPPRAHYSLANVLEAIGQRDEAVAAWREALRLRPDFPEALNNLGNTLHQLGKLAEAKAAFEEALRLKPDLPQAHNNLGHVLHD